MEYILVLTGWLVLVAATIVELRKIRIRFLSFSDGILLGAVYYLVVPLTVILFVGKLDLPDMEIRSYSPYGDLSTTLNLYLGWLLVLCFHSFSRIAIATNVHPIQHRPREMRSFYLFIGMLLVIEVVNFIVSGKAEGGHWQQNLAKEFQQSTLLIITFNIANAFRAMTFGYLLYLEENGLLSKARSAVFGALVCGVDIALTFNRITAAYFIIMLLVVYRRHMSLLVLLAVPAIPIVTYVSTVWATFRALALTHGLGLSNLMLALERAQSSAVGAKLGVSQALNAIFEVSNILVFKYLVENVPDRFPVLWGNTFVLKSFAFFIPSTVWPDKPKTFGVYLGYYVHSIQGLALNSTLFGEAYGNFFYFWPAALVLMLVLLQLVFRHIGLRRAELGFLGCFIGIGIWRFEMTFVFIGFVSIGTFYFVRFSLGAALNGLRLPAKGARKRGMQRTMPFTEQSKRTR